MTPAFFQIERMVKKTVIIMLSLMLSCSDSGTGDATLDQKALVKIAEGTASRLAVFLAERRIRGPIIIRSVRNRTSEHIDAPVIAGEIAERLAHVGFVACEESRIQAPRLPRCQYALEGAINETKYEHVRSMGGLFDTEVRHVVFVFTLRHIRSGRKLWVERNNFVQRLKKPNIGL